MSVDMVAAGMTGPVDIIDGRFGYFTLFESGGDIQSLLSGLGKPYKVNQMAHKPYPAGRATQAALTMIKDIRQSHKLVADEIAEIHIYLPPLVLLLVGRPPTVDMTPSYARLCLRFVMPLMLIDGDIDPNRYSSQAFNDEAINSLGAKMTLRHDGNPDSNALGPQRMDILLKNGSTLSATCEHPLGSPDNPLSKKQREDKVRRCFELGLPRTDPQQLIDSCETLSAMQDCRMLLDVVSGP
jgi:2-methylcitrate dehydratase PrpD